MLKPGMESESLLSIEENALEKLLHKPAKGKSNSLCVCCMNILSKQDSDLCGWSPSGQSTYKKSSRSQTKKTTGSLVSNAAGKRKSNRGKQSKTGNDIEKSYFCFQDTRKQHIEQYRKDFSTVQKADVIPDQATDPYMPERGNQSNLIMRVKLLETLSELYKCNPSIREVSMTSNGLPPVRIANPRNLTLSTFLKPKIQKKLEDNSKLNSKLSTSSYANVKESSHGNARTEDEDQIKEQLNSYNLISLEDSDSDGGKSLRKTLRCSPAQDEDLNEIQASNEPHFSSSLLLQSTESYKRAEKRLVNMIRPTQHFQNAASAIGFKTDMANHCRNGTKSPFSFCMNKFLSPNSRPRRQSTDRFDRRASLKERPGISNRGKSSPLYISILGKSPICREFYDGSN